MTRIVFDENKFDTHVGPNKFYLGNEGFAHFT